MTGFDLIPRRELLLKAEFPTQKTKAKLFRRNEAKGWRHDANIKFCNNFRNHQTLFLWWGRFCRSCNLSKTEYWSPEVCSDCSEANDFPRDVWALEWLSYNSFMISIPFQDTWSEWLSYQNWSCWSRCFEI